MLNEYPRRIYFHEKIFPGNLLLQIGSRKLQLSQKVFCQYNLKFNFTKDIFVIEDQKINLAIVLTSIKHDLTLF